MDGKLSWKDLEAIFVDFRSDHPGRKSIVMGQPKPEEGIVVASWVDGQPVKYMHRFTMEPNAVGQAGVRRVEIPTTRDLWPAVAEKLWPIGTDGLSDDTVSVFRTMATRILLRSPRTDLRAESATIIRTMVRQMPEATRPKVRKVMSLYLDSVAMAPDRPKWKVVEAAARKRKQRQAKQNRRKPKMAVAA